MEGDGGRNEAHPRRSVFVDEKNLSARRFRCPELVEVVSAALAETGMDLPDLALQIIGSVIVEQRLPALDIMGALMNLEVTIPIDGFGTGYPSTTYLERFPVDALRTDRSMVERVGEVAETSWAVVSATTGLAHALGLAVADEGVETAGELYQLRSMGCDFTQGYYRQRP